MCNKCSLNDVYVEKLKKRIMELEKSIDFNDGVLSTARPVSTMYKQAKLNKAQREKELLELKGELAELEFNQDPLPLNDANDVNNVNDDLFNTNDNGWHTISTTKTEDLPLNACDHQFVDVFDYKEESIYGESIIITKKYILSYCKVCGYTISRDNVCTE